MQHPDRFVKTIDQTYREIQDHIPVQNVKSLNRPNYFTGIMLALFLIYKSLGSTLLAVMALMTKSASPTTLKFSTIVELLTTITIGRT